MSTMALRLPSNELIDDLPRADGRRLLAACEPVSLAMAAWLGRWGESADFIYFPISGSVALLGQVQHRAALAVALVGREGVVGVQVVLGLRPAPMGARVQCAGQAMRIGHMAFGRELARSVALRQRLQRYLNAQTEQLSRAAACQCFHQTPGRLARWLLMCDDRAMGGTFHVTQEVLASLLGVRRVSVTIAAVALQRAGLIRYHRGEFTVLAHAKLSESACECYADDLVSQHSVWGRRGGQRLSR